MLYFYENRKQLIKHNLPLSIYRNTHFNFRAHWHTEVEIAYIEQGEVYVGVNDDRRKLCKGSLVICRGGDIHYYESLDRDSKVIVLVFKAEFLGLSTKWPDTHKFKSCFIEANNENQKEIHHVSTLIYNILEEMRNKKSCYDLIVRGNILELCAKLLRYFAEPEMPSKNDSRDLSKLKMMQEMLIYIEEHFTDAIQLQDLSKQFNVDAFYLSKTFNLMTGGNLKTYINTLRVAKAESLIESSTRPLIEIAMECGFNNIRTFNRAYKKIKGEIPSSKRSMLKDIKTNKKEK